MFTVINTTPPLKKFVIKVNYRVDNILIFINTNPPIEKFIVTVHYRVEKNIKSYKYLSAYRKIYYEHLFLN